MPLLLELIRASRESDDCPGGICDELETEIQSIDQTVNGPSTQNFGDFIRCVDLPRLVAAIREVITVISEGLSGCPAVQDDTETE